MATTLLEIEARLLAVMPSESTVDRHHHALAVAAVVFEARRRAAANTRAQIASARAHSERANELTRLLKDRMRERAR
jgi:hypothetical protein